MSPHQPGDQISYPNSPRHQDDTTLEEERHLVRLSSGEGEYLYPINTMNNYPGIPDKNSLFHGVEPIGSLSFGGKLGLYRHKKSEEYERASQRWADCSLEEWLAGSDGEHPS
jgi:hypothetical protein